MIQGSFNPFFITFYLSPATSLSTQKVKRDMVMIKHELDTVQQVKEEIEELREYVDRLEEHTHRRKLRLLEQVGGNNNNLIAFLSELFFNKNLFLDAILWVFFVLSFRFSI